MRSILSVTCALSTSHYSFLTGKSLEILDDSRTSGIRDPAPFFYFDPVVSNYRFLTHGQGTATVQLQSFNCSMPLAIMHLSYSFLDEI